MTERWRARPQTARARISNPVSGGQCHLNYLTILRRFSWPSLAYMCTKVADSFHFFYGYAAGGETSPVFCPKKTRPF